MAYISALQKRKKEMQQRRIEEEKRKRKIQRERQISMEKNRREKVGDDYFAGQSVLKFLTL